MAHNYFNDFFSMIVPYAWHLPDGTTVGVNGFAAEERRRHSPASFSPSRV